MTDEFLPRIQRAAERRRPLVALVQRWNPHVTRVWCVFWPNGTVTPHLYYFQAYERARSQISYLGDRA